MTDLFPIYEESFVIISQKIFKILENNYSYNGDPRDSQIKEAENNLKEADRLLSQMELEVVNKKGQDGRLQKVKAMRSEYDSFKKKVLRAAENLEMKRKQDDLFSGISESSNKEMQRQKLIDTEELAWKQHSALESAKRVSLEMEGISLEVMRQLDNNTQNMKGINNKVSSLNSELDQGSSIMGRILKKENRNKVVIALFSLVLFVLFVTFIYFKFFN